MKAFKYLIFILFLVPTLSHSAIKYYIGNSSNTFSTPQSACADHFSKFTDPFNHYKVELDGTYCNIYAENNLLFGWKKFVSGQIHFSRSVIGNKTT